MANDISNQRFGRLVAIKPTAERKYESAVWECRCDCGNVAFVASSLLRRGKTTSCGCNAIKDLTGQRFGKLVVIEQEKERKNEQVVWKCRCDYGNIVSVRGGNLRSGHTKACGRCSKKAPLPRPKDLTGQRFGKLVAMKPTEERKNGFVMWECQCDCGNVALVRSVSLLNGNTTSCGCLLAASEKKNGNAKDLTGQRFGLLLAVKPTEERERESIVWECLCGCGNTAFVTSSDLRQGKTTSCGCLKKERVAEARGKDLTGKRFGKLAVLGPTEKRKNGKRMWECKCDCGNTVFVRSTSLTSGASTSCGCTRRKQPE